VVDFALSGIAARARCVSDAWVTDWVAFGVSDRPVSLSTVKGLFDDHGLLKPGSEDVERAVTTDLAATDRTLKMSGSSAF